MSGDDRRFQSQTFDEFRRAATDSSLSLHEKVGFPDAYRAGREGDIFEDICAKLPALGGTRQTVLDVGSGCGPVATTLIAWCRAHDHTLLLADSDEMLRQLPDDPCVRKMAGYYPRDFDALFREYRGRVNAILVYSVLQYVFHEGNVFQFIDRSLTLLAPGGRLLLGDVPNISKRKRFFASDAGIRHHQAFSASDEVPAVFFNTLEEGHIDDGAVLGIVARCRHAGFDAYIVPQAPHLPMANRREDILIERP